MWNYLNDDFKDEICRPLQQEDVYSCLLLLFKGVPARSLPGFCLIFEHEMCKHGVKSVTVSLNRCNKQDQYMYHVFIFKLMVTSPENWKMDIYWNKVYSISSTRALSSPSQRQFEDRKWRRKLFISPAVAERRRWGFVDEAPAVVSHSSHWSLDERVGMVTGCSGFHSPVSRGTTSSFEYSHSNLQTGDLNSRFYWAFLFWQNVLVATLTRRKARKGAQEKGVLLTNRTVAYFSLFKPDVFDLMLL